MPEKLIERLERGISRDLEVTPKLRTIRALDPEMERVLLAVNVVGTTRSQMSAHALLGVQFVT
jgi:hypothetical protein